MKNALWMLSGHDQGIVERRVAKREHDAAIGNVLAKVLQSYASATIKAEKTSVAGRLFGC